ncbi:MAG: glycosyltransferase family 2 protein [Bacteroidota bacterium]
MPLQISVVICTYNRALYLSDALNSLYAQTLSKQYFEVIVANNNSTDQTEELCKQYIDTHPDMRIIYLNEKEQGASFARNTGAAIAASPLLCFMDDDAIANNDYLSRIVQFFETHPNSGGLGGRIIPRYIPSEPGWMSHYVSSMVGNFDYAPQVSAFRPGKYPLESNMIVPKLLFDKIGGFNTALPGVKGELRIGGEGKDFFFRLQALEHAIYYDPNIIVHHVVEVAKLTPAYLYRVASGYGRGERIRTLQKGIIAYVLKIIEYFLKLGASFILGIVYLLRRQPAKSWPVIRFRIDALKGLFNL